MDGLRRVQRPPGGTEYDEWEGHPLNGVPQEVLDLARRVMRECAQYGFLDPDDSAPIADAVVMTLHQAGRIKF
jgi:hypothetical protein